MHLREAICINTNGATREMPCSLIEKITVLSVYINMYHYQMQLSFSLALIPVYSFPLFSFIFSQSNFADNLCSGETSIASVRS